MFFFYTPCTLKTHPVPFHHFLSYQRLPSPLKIDDEARRAGVITTSLPLSETVSTELTGLFVEKPPENVVAVAGQRGRPTNKHYLPDYPRGATSDVLGYLLQELTSPSSPRWTPPL